MYQKIKGGLLELVIVIKLVCITRKFQLSSLPGKVHVPLPCTSARALCGKGLVTDRHRMS